ncbi:hypothetical protein BX666DRAFT_1994098 [Dichotomocladium elegans]|nr:hypothetical protein BX666DRAFT_1994098 [Dichotomocladium elegans]
MSSKHRILRHACTYQSLFVRHSSSLQASKEGEAVLKPVALDMIGTPDPVSNLRPVRYYIPPNETKEEREWRLLRQKVDDFNQNFWTANNTLFVNAKAEYEAELRRKGHDVTPEAMSVFYKDFLNKAYERQMEYNRNWWKLSVSMLYPGMKATLRYWLKSRDRSSLHQERASTNFWEKSFES